ncbi:MAG TPA: PP2C family protein-serine/threonine phosphatase [Actinophytocola sp.]|uniref:PP2C family protein-serine/threonine phosphatase n=1 Tax=Actinophytocola sp. TaxID=1872138 RepID=UPI002DDC9038|nr:PP2C family protein-serine/threonine phosphatase [Actinophytocola sp.]HEV2784107.1 PP2C family protein-serine/threonine phosphatase [Actinophytocola sp.]
MRRATPPASAPPAEVEVDVPTSDAFLPFLTEVGSRLIGAIDLDTAAVRAVELAVPTLADCAVLVLPDIRGRLQWWRWSGRGRCVRGRIRRPSAENAPTLAAAIADGEVVVDRLPDTELAALPRSFADPLSRYPEMSVVSLAGSDTTLGALVLARRDSRPVPVDQLRATERFVECCARAIAAARRFERHKAAANDLLSTLRPPALPSVPSIRLAAIYRPADGPVDVGGDFYDVHPQADGSTLIALGDVCGNGAEAAALSGRFRHALAALRLVENDPHRLLRLLNQAMLGAGSNKFATLVVASAIRRGGGALLLRMSSGGHPAPLVVRRDGTVDVVTLPGMLVGIMAQARFGENTVELRPYDTMVLYTDGITEARGGAGGEELFGQERLRAVLAGCAGLPVEKVVERVDEAVRRWSGGDSRDDIALLAVQSAPGQ